MVKKSIVIEDRTVEFFEARTRFGIDDVGWSASVNGAISELQTLLIIHLPDLSDTSWLLLANAFSSHGNTPGMVQKHLAGCVMDDLGEFDINELKPEYAAAIRELAGLSPIESHAAYCAILEYWANDITGGPSEFIAQKIRFRDQLN